MARSFTVSELVLRVRRSSGMLGDDNPDDPEIVEALSDEYCELYAILLETKKNFFSAKQTITTSGSANGEALPDDYLGTLRLDRDPGASQQLEPLYEIQLQELHKYARSGPFATGFLIVGPGSGGDSPGVLELIPTPPAGQTYLHRYIPAPKKLTLLSTPGAGEINVIEGFMGWENRLVLGAVKRLLRSENPDPNAVANDVKESDEKIRSQTEERNAMQATTIADVESYDGWSGYSRYRLPRP